MAGNDIDMKWYSGFGNLPFSVPTKADLEEEGDPRKKVEVSYKGWSFRMFDMHNADEVKAYEKLRSELVDMLRLKRGQMVKDCAQLLATKSGQHLYYILEWAEYDVSIVTAEDLVKDTKKEQPKDG